MNATNAWASLINIMAGMSIDIPIRPYKHQSIITQPIERGSIKPMVISFRHLDVMMPTSLKPTIGGIIEAGIWFKPTILIPIMI